MCRNRRNHDTKSESRVDGQFPLDQYGQYVSKVGIVHQKMCQISRKHVINWDSVAKGNTYNTSCTLLINIINQSILKMLVYDVCSLVIKPDHGILPIHIHILLGISQSSRFDDGGGE